MTARARPEGEPELSVERIVTVAIELLDDDGISAFSMRSLARRLGHSTMATYRHVPNRATLLQLAAEAVHTELPNVDGLPWYDQLLAYTRHRWTHTWRPHPWIIDYVGRGGLSPAQAASGAELVNVFRSGGFRGAELHDAVLAHWAFVQGTLRIVLSDAPGMTPDPESFDETFDFNLRTWIAGFVAVRHGWTPSSLERGSP